MNIKPQVVSVIALFASLVSLPWSQANAEDQADDRSAVLESMSPAGELRSKSASDVRQTPLQTFQLLINSLSEGNLSEYRSCYTEAAKLRLFHTEKTGEHLLEDQIQRRAAQIKSTGFKGIEVRSFQYEMKNGKPMIAAEIISSRNSLRTTERVFLELVDTDGRWKVDQFSTTTLRRESDDKAK